MLEALEQTWASLLEAQDRLFLLPVYDAGGTADRSVNSDALCERLVRRRMPAETADGYGSVIEAVSAACRPGDLVLVAGARDPGLPLLSRRILAAL